MALPTVSVSLAVSLCMILGPGIPSVARTSSPETTGPRVFAPPSAARQLVLVTSQSDHPARSLAVLQAYQRSNSTSPWKRELGPWTAEVGVAGLKNHKHEGDGSTPTGTFPIALTMYGNDPNPGGLRYRYHHLVCGDWWDEDPFSTRYNRFVQVPCGTTPPFASRSEALWTETLAYPYFAVIETNNNPVVGGVAAAGSGIFLHNWLGFATQGCVALHRQDLLTTLRWLRPGDHPVFEIGTDRQVRQILEAQGLQLRASG